MPATDTPHLLPQNLEAEEAMIGAILLNPDTLDLCDQLGFRVEDFYRPSHRTIYDTAKYLHDRGTVDELAVVNELRARRKLKDVGGAPAVMTLAEKCPAVANAKAYIDEVIDQAKLRSLVETGNEIARLGYEHPDKIGKLIDRSVHLTDAMAKSCERTQGHEANAETLSEWLSHHALGQIAPRPRFAYPFPRLQAATGGFGKTEVISIGGYSGDGKSAFKNQIILGLPRDTKVGVFTLEMTEEEEQLRFASSITGIPYNKMWNPLDMDMDERTKIVEAAENLGDYNYTIHSGIRPMSSILAEQRRKKYDVVIIDHFHLIPGAADHRTMESNAADLKRMAMDTECCVINLFQFNRSEDRGFPPPTVNRVRGGNALLDASNTMMFVFRHRPDGVYPGAKSEVIVAKHRGGKSGYSIPFTFVPDRIAFEEDA